MFSSGFKWSSGSLVLACENDLQWNAVNRGCAGGFARSRQLILEMVLDQRSGMLDASWPVDGAVVLPMEFGDETM